MAKVLNEERFNPSRLPGLSLWIDAQATSTISASSVTGVVTSWSDRSGMGNTLNSTTFSVPGCTLWLDAADPNGTGVPAANGATISLWKDKSGLGCNATGASVPITTQYTTPLNTVSTVSGGAISSTVTVTVIGGGGGGGSWGAGASGGIATYTFTGVTLGSTITYYVGSGGTCAAQVFGYGGSNSYVTIGSTTIYAGGGGGGGPFDGYGTNGVGQLGGIGQRYPNLASNGGISLIASAGTRVSSYGTGGAVLVDGSNGIVVITMEPPPPTINSTGLNGRPTMNFGGSSWFTGLTANTTSNLTVFAVVMLSGNAVNNSRIVSLATPTKVDYNTYTEVLALQQWYTNTWIATGRNTQPPGVSTAFNFVASIDYSTTSNIPYIAGALYNGSGSTQTLFINGSANVTNTITGAFGYTSYGIGNYSAAPGASEPFTGKISEILIFNTAVTTFQRQQIEIYLSRKWSIPLSYSIPSFVPVFSPLPSPSPIISNTAIISQPSVFFPPGAQMVSTLNSGLGAPTISGCVLWLDAADTTTYVGPTSSLTGWKDKSGSGYVATPLSGTITTATLNGTPVLEFSNNRMIIPNFTWNMSFTSIMVWKPTSGNQMIGLCASTAANATWYDYISTGNWSLAYLNTATSSTDTNYIQGPTDRFPGSPAPVAPVNQWFIFSIGYTAGTTTITNYAVNGSARTSSAVSPQTGTNTGVYFINGLANLAYGYSQVAEIMHFNRSLGSDERQTIEGYLATKWGLRANLPPTHPYSSVPYTAAFTLNPSTPVSKSIFIAYQTPSLTSTMRFATGNDVSGGAFGFSQTQYYVSAPYQYDYGNTRWTTNTVLYTLPTVLSGIYDASAGIIRGDRNFNADSDVRESAMINIISNTPYSLGRSPVASSIVTSASFHLCEIIAYNRALATTDRQMIEGYMAWKWGITNQLPIGHPYKEFPPSGEQVIIPSTPANVMQGLISWLDMADTSSYTLSGTTLKTIRDKATTTGTFTISGKPNNFSFSRIGSLPALVFPGNNTSTVSDNTFLFRSVPVPSVGSTCMVLIPKSQFTASKLGILGWGSPGNSLGNPGLGYNSPTTTIQTLQSYNTSNSTFFGPSLNLAADTPMILFWAWYGGNMVYFSCNGTNLLTSTQGTTAYYNPASTDTQFYIGNDGGFGAQFTLGELMMYNQYGETPFRNLIEGHLAWKWGLQTNLPAYHPYYYSAPGLQSLTEVNALSQPSDILNLTMWLDAADTATLTLTPTTFTWTDKSAVANHVVSTTSGNAPIPSSFGTARRPSVYFGPGKTAKSTYNSGASAGQFSAFIVASVPTLSYLLISTGQYTTATTPAANQTFAFYASNGSTYGVCSPFVGGGGTKVGNYSTVCGATVEMFASVSGLTTLGNLNFGSTVSGTRATTADTQWVFGDCSGDPSPKSFHVHEFITYSRQLATNERWVIEGYLYWKWINLI